MPLKSVIDIEINDEPFTRFKEMFDKYREQLKASSADWKKTGDQIGATSDKMKDGIDDSASATESLAIVAASAAAAFHEIAQAVTKQSVEIVRAVTGTRDLSRGSRSIANNWSDMARDSKTFAKNIYDATNSLLRWSGLTGVIGGLLGGGGLFGIERLATAAGSQRRGALGLGVSAGDEKAFDINYGKVVDTQNFLSGVNDALHDVTKRWTLTSSGLTPNQIQGKNTAEVAGLLLPQIKSLVDRSNPANLEQVRQQIGTTLSLQDLERLRSTPASEVAKYGQDYERDRKTFNLPDPVLKQWQDLQTTLQRAGVTLENVLITGLAKLTKPIEDLSNGFVHLVEALSKSPVVKGWIEDLAVGLEKTAKWISSPEFEQNVLSFVKRVGQLGDSIRDVVIEIDKWIEWFRGSTSKDNPFAGGDPGTDPHNNKLPDLSAGSSLKDKLNHTIPKPDEHPWWSSGAWWDGLKNWWNGKSDVQKSSYNMLENDNGLPSGLISRVEYKESGGRDVVSPVGAKGFLQFTDATAKDYGVNVHDEASSASGAARYLSRLRDNFGGDLEKGLAAYNWGPAKLQKDIDDHKEQWKQYLPDETKDYIRTILGGGSIGSPGNSASASNNRVTITVYNNTGGAAAITTSQLVV